ncbi:MAG TPA: DedA family protein [Gaiellaceae bacterium]|nr:DedA family protein [Gaiellaceae bacterium]
MTHFVEHYGLWVVFGVIFLEVAGLPFIPGETVLITAGALASQGHGNIVAIIAVAIAAAILGALFGYIVGRRYGKDLLVRWPRLERASHKGIARSQEFFHQHGSKAVFLGRFVPVVRATIGWMAGIGEMRFGRFLVWNVTGAVAWGLLIGLLSYYLGQAVVDAIERDLGIGIGIIVVIALVVFLIHLRRRRTEA